MSGHTRFAVAGGGTGGHVTLALALGEEMARRGDRVLFVGSSRGLENRLVPEAGFDLVSLPARPVAGQGFGARIGAGLALARGSLGAVRVLLRFEAELVVSVGGYAAVPAAAAALLLRKPLVVVEPNAIPGRTNRFLARFAGRVFTAFDVAARSLAERLGPERVRCSGAPLRRRLLDAFADTPGRRAPELPLRLLVVGGSQGARQLNEAMLDALPRLDPASLEVFHQAGAADRERVAAGYRQAGWNAQVVDFEPDLPGRYAWADVALCRAGALTVAELAMAGLPALLVPYPYAADDHQRANARALEEVGAGRLLDPASFDGKQLVETLGELVAEPEILLEMGRRAGELARPHAAAQIVDACHELLSEREGGS